MVFCDFSLMVKTLYRGLDISGLEGDDFLLLMFLLAPKRTDFLFVFINTVNKLKSSHNEQNVQIELSWFGQNHVEVFEVLTVKKPKLLQTVGHFTLN